MVKLLIFYYNEKIPNEKGSVNEVGRESVGGMSLAKARGDRSKLGHGCYGLESCAHMAVAEITVNLLAKNGNPTPRYSLADIPPPSDERCREKIATATIFFPGK
jgi:hypothetical protein